MLEPVRARREVGQRAHALVERGAALGVEARDQVGQVGLVGAAVEAGRQPVADGRAGADHERGREHARGRQQRARAARAQAGERERDHADEPPVAQRQHAVGDLRGGRLVRDEHDGAALGGAGAQQPQHLGAGLDVEVAGRLVGEQHARGR